MFEKVKVRDSQGQVGWLVSIDSTRNNPFKIESLDGSASWYTVGVTAI
ncbi:hypothetical protein [Vibrio owensii]